MVDLHLDVAVSKEIYASVDPIHDAGFASKETALDVSTILLLGVIVGQFRGQFLDVNVEIPPASVLQNISIVDMPKSVSLIQKTDVCVGRRQCVENALLVDLGVEKAVHLL